MDASWGLFGGLSKPLGGSFDAAFVAPGASWGPLGGLLGPLGVLFGASWGLLGPKARNVRSCSPSVASLEAVLGLSWAVLGPSWAVLGSSGAVLGPFWAVSEPFRGPFGPSWDDLWSLLNRFGSFLARKGENPKNRQKPLKN